MKSKIKKAPQKKGDFPTFDSKEEALKAGLKPGEEGNQFFWLGENNNLKLPAGIAIKVL